MGDQTAAVADLQTALAALGFPISSEEAGSGFGNETCNAVINFKTKYNIPSHNCVVDKQTVAAMVDGLSKLPQFINQVIPVDFITPPLFYGMESKDVRNAQIALEALAYGVIDTAELKQGIFGDTTCAALTTMQQKLGISVNTCYVDQPTADKINQLLADPGQAYKVSGKVLNILNEPIGGQDIVAYDIDLIGAKYYKKIDSVAWFGGGMQKLGEAKTDINGYYEINFHQSDFADAEGDSSPDVVSFVTTNGAVPGKSALSTKKDFAGGTTLENWNIIISTSDIRGL